MKEECWCGCGRTLGRSESRVAERAFEAEVLVAALRERQQSILAATGTDAVEFEAFVEYGERTVGELLMVAHGELPAGALDRRGSNRWHKVAARVLRHSGPTGYEVVQELRRSLHGSTAGR